ncbi:MAG: rRNA maturation RNase YbeY [Clostridia bacterium]|nr:rRNA maturation RNase YbeY [Clostridia bacterium]
MAKLKVYVNGQLDGAENICDAVYKTLSQRVNLYAELDMVSPEEIRQINRDNRHIDAVTDVLSFPMLDGIRGKVIKKKDFPYDYDEEEKAIFLGSIVICEERAKAQAAEYGHTLQRELSYLFVHGLMHLFGYDHMTDEDKKQMREKEEQALACLGITR